MPKKQSCNVAVFEVTHKEYGKCGYAFMKFKTIANPENTIQILLKRDKRICLRYSDHFQHSHLETISITPKQYRDLPSDVQEYRQGHAVEGQVTKHRYKELMGMIKIKPPEYKVGLHMFLVSNGI